MWIEKRFKGNPVVFVDFYNKLFKRWGVWKEKDNKMTKRTTESLGENPPLIKTI
jgi:hypothetical protein